MAKFKNKPQTYLFRKMIGFWHNLVQNLDETCHDDDLFDPVAANVSRERVASLVKAAFTEGQVKEMQETGSRRDMLDFSDSPEEILMQVWNHEGMRRKCRMVCSTLKDIVLDGLSRKRAQKENFQARVDELQRVLKLSDFEREVMELAYVKANTCFDWPRRVETADVPRYFAMALDRDMDEVMAVMAPTGRLRRFNVLDDDWDFNRRVYGSFLIGTEKEAIERRFYRKTDVSEALPWEFYGDLSERHGALLKRLLAAKQGKLNILLYGAPGTGKTSFAKTLAKEMGLSLYEIRQGDADGRNTCVAARHAGIQVCNEQLDVADSLIMVDEADEILRDSDAGFSLFGISFGGGGSTEKGVTNTILDDMKIPCIWISNAPARRMDESVRRRFDYSICFERLNASQRESIWRNAVEKQGLQDLFPEEKILGLAAKYETSAGGIANVLANVKRLAPASTEVDDLVAALMKQHCELMMAPKSDTFAPAKDYSLDGLNVKGKVSPEKIARSVENYLRDDGHGDVDRPRMNVLLWGPPGSGKTEFVKYLGHRLGRKVIVKKGSDILGMYVGQNEQNIRDAFREAEAQHAILFFDEIDGLLQNRANAHQNWEVTQVNELLQQMEEFNGVMVAATNFFENLDPAVMRRFTFKLQFDFLDADGKKAFFERFFKTTLTREEEEDLAHIPNLCPGDFRTVRQSQYYLGDEVTNADRLEALREESAVKPKTTDGGPIGF